MTLIASCPLTDAQRRAAKSRIWGMALPVMADNLFQLMGGFVVMILVGHVSVLAAGAVGLALRLTQLVWAIYRGLATAVTVFTAQAIGARDGERVRSLAFQSVYLGALASMAIAALIFLFADKLLLLFNPRPEIYGLALSYLRIVCLGLPFISIMQIAGGIMQGAGNTGLPMLATFLLNATMILAVLPAFALRHPNAAAAVRFAAIATVAGQALAAFFALYSVFIATSQVPLMSRLARPPRPDRKIFAALLRLGLPSSAEFSVWQIAAIVISRIILSFGETDMGAYQLGLQVEALSYMPAAGLSIAITSLVGRSIGAKERELARYYFRSILRYTFWITAAIAALFLFANRFLMSLMTNDLEAVALGARYIFLMGLVQLPQNLTGAIFGAMRASGFTRQPMLIAMAGLWGLRVPLSLALSFMPGVAVTTVWAVMCVDLVLRFVLALAAFRRMNIFGATALEL